MPWTCVNAMVHPLELPELLRQIASYLPVFAANPLGGYIFHPHDIISCLKVCRIWNLTISPLLWMMYDSCETARWRIPSHLLEIQSRHFRYIRLTMRRQQFAFRSTQVQELEVLSAVNSCIALELIRANPQLRALSLYLPSGRQRPEEVEDAQSAIETLSRLERLSLNEWVRFTDTRLVQCLNNNPGLRELTLSSFIGIDRIDGCRSLNRLTHLTLDSDLKRNRGLVQLVQFCPNLEQIALRSNADPCVPDLGKALRESCPRLTRVKFVPCEVHSRIFLGPLDYEALIQATPRLLHCEIVTDELTPQIFQTILSNSTWLTTMRFRMYGRSSEVFSMANRLLASCYHLTTLELMNEDSWWVPESCKDLFKHKWVCRQLESIHLEGVESPLLLGNSFEIDWESERSDPRSSINPGPTHLEIVTRHGWVASEIKKSRDGYLTPNARSTLVGAFLEHAADSPRLCKIILNHFKYTRNPTNTK